MTFAKLNPAARAGADRARELFTAANAPEITENLPDLHKIRVAHLAHRFRLAPIAAGVVASLAFGEARR